MSQVVKLLWLCGVPFELEQNALGGKKVGAHASWSWVMAHLPPPAGVELHIACPAKISEDVSVEYNGAVFHLFPDKRGAAYSLYRFWMPGFRRVFKKVAPDWVHGWGVEAGFGSAATALAPSKSSIEIQGILSDYSEYVVKSLPFWFALLNERISLARGQRFIAESAYSGREASKYTSGKVRIVNQPLRDGFLKTPLGEGVSKHVVFLGSLEERKGIKDAIKAFASAQAPGWRMLCIGGGRPTYAQEVRALIDELGMADRTELCGRLAPEEITVAFQQSPVFLLPTYMDTGPNALKEAMAMGLWPICYDNSGPGEFIRRYGFGTVVETGNVTTLSEALKHALSEEPWRNALLKESCVKRIRHDLSREAVWPDLIASFTQSAWL